MYALLDLLTTLVKKGKDDRPAYATLKTQLGLLSRAVRNIKLHDEEYFVLKNKVQNLENLLIDTTLADS